MSLYWTKHAISRIRSRVGRSHTHRAAVEARIALAVRQKRIIRDYRTGDRSVVFRWCGVAWRAPFASDGAVLTVYPSDSKRGWLTKEAAR